MSNYHNFGAMKFVPELDSDKFWGILASHPKANLADSAISLALAKLRPLVYEEVFAYQAPYTQLNFPDEGGVTAYFSRDMGKDDLAITKEFLQSPEAVAKGLDILNTRTFK